MTQSHNKPDTFAGLVSLCSQCHLANCLNILRAGGILSVRDIIVRTSQNSLPDTLSTDQRTMIAQICNRIRVTDSTWALSHANEYITTVSTNTTHTTSSSSSSNSRSNAYVVPYDRPDLPQLRSHKRGCIQAALDHTEQPADKVRALAAVEAAKYSANSVAPRNAKWNTWCKFAQQWDLPPLPLSVPLIKATAACFLQGQYRTPEQYFSLARQRHIQMTGQRPSADVELEIKDSIRAITRGMGPTKKKETFFVEHLRPFLQEQYMTPCRQAAGMDESSSTARTPSHWPTSSTSGEETRQSLSALCPHPWLLDAANTVLPSAGVSAWILVHDT